MKERKFIRSGRVKKKKLKRKRDNELSVMIEEIMLMATIPKIVHQTLNVY
jgi:mannosyltransferase OCH1-like enzyme